MARDPTGPRNRPRAARRPPSSCAPPSPANARCRRQWPTPYRPASWIPRFRLPPWLRPLQGDTAKLRVKSRVKGGQPGRKRSTVRLSPATSGKMDRLSAASASRATYRIIASSYRSIWNARQRLYISWASNQVPTTVHTLLSMFANVTFASDLSSFKVKFGGSWPIGIPMDGPSGLNLTRGTSAT